MRSRDRSHSRNPDKREQHPLRVEEHKVVQGREGDGDRGRMDLVPDANLRGVRWVHLHV